MNVHDEKELEKLLSTLYDDTDEVVALTTTSTIAKIETTVIDTHAFEAMKEIAHPAVLRPVAKIEVKAPESSGKYRFPNNANYLALIERFRDYSINELRSALRTIELSAEVLPYTELRDQYCAIHVVLNERQAIPPVLRPKIFSSAKPAKTSPEALASNDRQVIDLHWLAQAGCEGVSERWNGIFKPVFNFEVAAKFVSTVGTGENKAGELSLSRKEMLLLSTISNPVANARKYDIRKLLALKGGTIKTLMGMPRSRIKCSADEMIKSYHALLLTDLDELASVTVMKQAFEISVDLQTMRRRKHWLLKNKVMNPLKD